MTEIEAYTLKIGELVVVTPKKAPPRSGVVQQVIDGDYTPELAMEYQHFPLIVARTIAFDGPIIVVVEKNGHRAIWSAPMVTRPQVGYAIRCVQCYNTYTVWLDAEGINRFKLGEKPDVCFPKLCVSEIELIQSHTCGRCLARILKK